jgi:predicted ATPase with chaperone activity
MSDIILDDQIVDLIGQAVNTGRSMFLFREPGNGKTAIAERVAELLGGYVLIPHAVLVDGHVITVLDVQNHRPIPVPPGRVEYDRRWVLCKRPAVMVGGELTLASPDLVYDPIAKVCEAPPQMKANNGLFLIDDFGRQQVRPQGLLNRSAVPLEKRVDFLTLRTGKKIEISFRRDHRLFDEPEPAEPGRRRVPASNPEQGTRAQSYSESISGGPPPSMRGFRHPL